jgi:hypothetical protein
VMLPHKPTHMINLRGGLDIRLNCENERGDPAGTTSEYRLIVPALDYRGPGDPNPESVKPKGRLSKWFSGAASDRRHLHDHSQDSFTPPPTGQHNRPGHSYDSIEQEPIPVPVPPQQHRRRDSLSSPDNPVLGPNGLPIRQKTRPVANTSAPLPATNQQPPSMSMRRQDLPAQQQRADQRMQAPPSLQPDTYAGPNTVIPATLPGPPAGPPPNLRGAVATSPGQRVASDSRYSQRAAVQSEPSAERRRMSAEVKRGANAGYV